MLPDSHRQHTHNENPVTNIAIKTSWLHVSNKCSKATQQISDRVSIETFFLKAIDTTILIEHNFGRLQKERI